jgi:outer membrane protein OmpA-like peptidoglycan-associated protein
MAEVKVAKKDEKAARVHRKADHESILTPIFSVAREVRSPSHQPSNPPTSNTSAHRSIQTALQVSTPGDFHELEADRVAEQVMRFPAALPSGGVNQSSGGIIPILSRAPSGDSGGGLQAAPQVEASVNRMSGGSPLPDYERNFFESRMGYDFSQVRVHTDGNAVQMSRDLQAHAFTYGSNIAFNQGMYAPGTDSGRRLLAHELTHVVQQTGGAQRKGIQRAIDPAYPLTNGTFNVTVTTGGSNLPITIAFHPSEAAPISNQIGLIQIVKLTNASGANVEPQSLPAARGGSLRTTANADTGAEGGYFTDVLHNQSVAGTGGGNTPQGSALPPQYPFGNAPAPGTPPPEGLSRPNSGGAGPATIGYKRSNDPNDIKDAELTDAPGYSTVNPSNPDIKFEFETVAKGEDVGVTYGALKWGVDITSGVTANEHASAQESSSATFAAALELHRDFYVHEPVIFYFDFDSDVLKPEEAAKIDEFQAYLQRNTDVQVTPTGYADRRGSQEYNRGLAMRRADAVNAALATKGVPATQISGIEIAMGSTEAFTADATTGQDLEANRQFNRRVVLTFRHVPGTPPAGGAGGGGGGP